MQAAVLSVKLKYIDEAIEKRRKVAQMYIDALSDCPEIRIPKINGDQKAVYYVFNILVENRDGLQEYLKEKEIGTSIYYPKPLHEQKCFDYLGYKEGDLPNAEYLSNRTLAIPIDPELNEEEKEEQQKLRRVYIDRVKSNFKVQLEGIEPKNPTSRKS